MSNIARLYLHLRGDKLIWAIMAFLSCFSILAVYSAGGVLAFKNSLDAMPEMYLVKQAFFIVLGFLVTYFFYKLHYVQYSRMAPFLLLIAIVLMAYTTFFAPEINQAKRWIPLPFNQTFQTSDFARVALIIYVARALAMNQDSIKDWKQIFMPVIVPILIICGLIMPADFSTAGILFITVFIMIIVGRVPLRFVGVAMFGGMMIVGTIFILGLYFPDIIRSETWMSRIQEYVTTSDGDYQVQQSKIAIANGGLFGQGPGNSIQRNSLPYAYSDFIYAIICEEYGLIGAFVVMMLYLTLLYRCIRIVIMSPRAFGAILALGLCLNIVVQAFANIAVSVQLVPVTGLTLPMVSKGGTSMLFACVSFGVILSVSRYAEAAQMKKQALVNLENQADESSD